MTTAVFDAAEYADRLARVRREMAVRGLDVLVLSDPCNLYYLSGYEAWSFYVPQYLIVPADDSHPVWFGRAMDLRGAEITTGYPADAIHAYPDNYVQSAERHPADLLAAMLVERGWAKARIGIETASYYLTVQAHQHLQRGLPGASLVDASLLVNWVRLVKSPAEIALMRQAGRIVERAMTVATDHIAVGVRQCDVAAEIYRALISGTPEYGGQYASSPPLMPCGERVATPHLSWTDDPYQAGQQTNFELVASRHRYHMPLSRSVYLGQPSPRLRELEHAALDGIDAVFAMARPGVTAAEVEAAWQTAAARHGVRKPARCGYAIGIAYPPTFGELTASLRPGDETVLEEGMTFHLMPGLWLDGESIVITEPFVVTASGAEPFCGFPRRLFAKA
jgi:ectoine hydrolase